MNRRNFVKLAGLGGVVFASGLARGAATYGSSQGEFAAGRGLSAPPLKACASASFPI